MTTQQMLSYLRKGITKYKMILDGDKIAVDNISLEVSKGDLFGFIGHNGAGKSTTIKSVVGILSFDEGDVLIDGVSIKKDPIACKKQLAYIPDNPDVYESITGIAYLNLVADIFKIDKEERKQIIEKYADLLKLTKEELNNYISSYSHGMRQKLLLISAFVHHPKLLILDEPFVGLDPTATYQVKTIMKEFCDQGGAIFFSTHILEVAEKLCNKVAIIKNGKIVVCGKMEEITKDSDLEDVFLELTNHA